MKLYTFPLAPNPAKLDIYLREKGIEIPQQLVSLPAGEQSEPVFTAVNPLGALPVLELDDGTHLSESLAIIEYLEELHPEPPMIGRSPLERARVREIERIIDSRVLGGIARLVHATRSPLPGVEPKPDIEKQERERLPRVLAVVDERIGSAPFVAGDRPTIADCTLFGAMRFGGFFGVEIGPEYTNIHRWHATFSERPSAA